MLTHFCFIESLLFPWRCVVYVDAILQVCRGTQKIDKRWIGPSVYYPRGNAIILAVIRRLMSVKGRAQFQEIWMKHFWRSGDRASL